MERLRALDGKLDGAILDLGLPDRPGDVPVGEIRSIRPDMAIVVASGHSETGMRDRFEDTTGMAFVTKPYEFGELSKALELLWSRLRQ